MKKLIILLVLIVAVVVAAHYYQKHAEAMKAGASLEAISLTQADNGAKLVFKQGQHFTVALGDPASLGYSYDNPEYDTSLVHLDGRHTAPAADQTLGHSEDIVWEFQAVKKGATDLTITASKPAGEKMEYTYKVTVSVQ